MRACAVALALAVASTASAQTATFQFTGGLQTWQVPANVTSVHVIADGGQGGASFAGTGGAGGRIEATVPVMPGSQLVILVGGAGEDAGWPVTGGGGGGGN
ncbi:MAG: hypothetical protein KAI24_07175 [Planctomycetes bacterium]|nr:hypothetical protein [Planctomycetota bacterium]